MKTFVTVALLLWAVWLPAVILSERPTARTTPRAINAPISGFNKGDCIVVTQGGKKVTVTLWGIDAPELDQPGGKESVANLHRLVGNNSVRIEVVNRDRFGRLAAKVYAGNVYLNLQMAADGYAWWDRHFAAGAREIQAAETQARQARRGIWQNVNNIDPFEWRKKYTARQPQEQPQPSQQQQYPPFEPFKPVN